MGAFRQTGSRDGGTAEATGESVERLLQVMSRVDSSLVKVSWFIQMTCWAYVYVCNMWVFKYLLESVTLNHKYAILDGLTTSCVHTVISQDFEDQVLDLLSCFLQCCLQWKDTGGSRQLCGRTSYLVYLTQPFLQGGPWLR